MVTDALDQLGTCERCGASIKYIYEFEGRTYGSTCIEAVSDIRPDNWVWVDGKANEKATRQSLTEKKQARQERIAKEAALTELREGIRQANRDRFAEVINVLKNASSSEGDFCHNIARNIETDGFETDLYLILGQYPYNIVREIWGKQTGGRKNSKAYKAAVVEFDEKFDDEEE